MVIYCTQTPSVASFFGPKIESKQVQKHTTMPICMHLSGPPYEEYILHICTCCLGGISPEFHTQAICQLFPYKKFPPLEKDPKQKGLKEVIFIEASSTLQRSKLIPSDGNDKLKEVLWMEAEKQCLDKFMLGWARWEVNYVNGCIQSTCCEGTSNGDQICDRCKELLRDESLKCAIQKVSHRS